MPSRVVLNRRRLAGRSRLFPVPALRTVRPRRVPPQSGKSGRGPELQPARWRSGSAPVSAPRGGACWWCSTGSQHAPAASEDNQGHGHQGDSLKPVIHLDVRGDRIRIHQERDRPIAALDALPNRVLRQSGSAAPDNKRFAGSWSPVEVGNSDAQRNPAGGELSPHSATPYLEAEYGDAGVAAIVTAYRHRVTLTGLPLQGFPPNPNLDRPFNSDRGTGLWKVVWRGVTEEGFRRSA